MRRAAVKCERSDELRILAQFVTVVIVGRVSSTTEDLDLHGLA